MEHQAGLLAQSQLLQSGAWVGGQAGAGDHSSCEDGGWEEGAQHLRTAVSKQATPA